MDDCNCRLQDNAFSYDVNNDDGNDDDITTMSEMKLLLLRVLL